MKAFLEKYYWLPLLALCGFYCWRATGFPAHDFANYYFGAKFLAQGHFSSWVYFPYEFNKAITSEGFSGIFASYAPNTPFLAMAFLPFTFFGLFTAKLLFNLFSVYLFLYTLQRLVSFYDIDRRYVWLVPVLFFMPIRNNLLFGQTYFLIFFLIGETWLAYKKSRPLYAGLMLALAVLFKIFPMLLILVFAFRKKTTLLTYTGFWMVLLLGLSILFSSVDIWIFFCREVLPKASGGEISEAYVPNYQSVLMFLKEWLVYDRVENPSGWKWPGLFSALLVGFKIGLMAIGYYISRKVRMPLYVLSYWILAMLLLSPYGSTYTYILLVIPFLALARKAMPAWRKTAGFALLLLACNLPVSLILNWDFPLRYAKLMVLLLFFLGVLILAYRKIRWLNVTAIAGIAMLLLFFKNEETAAPEAVLDKKAPILIHDFVMADHSLSYSYFDETGENRRTIPFTGQTAEPAQMGHNQIFYRGHRLTSDNSHKLKPMVIDGETLVYLSDCDRGIGFYTLRKIKLSGIRKNESGAAK